MFVLIRNANKLSLALGGGGVRILINNFNLDLRVSYYTTAVHMVHVHKSLHCTCKKNAGKGNQFYPIPTPSPNIKSREPAPSPAGA